MISNRLCYFLYNCQTSNYFIAYDILVWTVVQDLFNIICLRRICQVKLYYRWGFYEFIISIHMTSDWVKLVFLRVSFNTHKPCNENVEKFDSTCAYLIIIVLRATGKIRLLLLTVLPSWNKVITCLLTYLLSFAFLYIVECYIEMKYVMIIVQTDN